jgi:iron complex outermembrane receptor protein
MALFSNNRMGAINVNTEKASKQKQGLAWRVGATFKKAGNAKTPGYWLQNSGLQESNVNTMLGIKKAKHQTELYYSFFSTKIGIFAGSHIGNVTDLNNTIGMPMKFSFHCANRLLTECFTFASYESKKMYAISAS